MTQIFNVYCDESCHLENDHQSAMILGAVWCPVEKVREISNRLREIKLRHGLKKDFEVKWTKVSPAKQQFYLDIIDYFFDDDDLHFRALIIPDKSKLDHVGYQQDHNTWYYKMYFNMLKVILDPHACYRIYIDIKDTNSAEKVSKLHEVLVSAIFDFSRKIVERLQTVRSHEIEILQLADLLIGAVSHLNRGLAGSSAKQAIIERIRERSGYSLTRNTLVKENKVNIFRWQASEVLQ
ncbi:MAG TPA: DUF3800 domain-containing protein [Leptolyngbyaceae cyanobacterium M33_DOE_097]|nr:DUF3800 domain-containing protein [Leptolyngbyaceae cyanobacterium M33_DOE_097]